MSNRTIVIKCQLCEDTFFYKDFQRKEDATSCSCKNVKLFWKEIGNSRYGHYFAVEYDTSRPEIFEANEKNIDERYPFR